MFSVEADWMGDFNSNISIIVCINKNKIDDENIYSLRDTWGKIIKKKLSMSWKMKRFYYNFRLY